MKNEKVNITTDEGKIVEAIAPMVLSVSRATDIPAFIAIGFSTDLTGGIADGQIHIMAKTHT